MASKNNPYRSIELQEFISIYSPDAEWKYLQKEIRENDLAMLRQLGHIAFLKMT
jgi:hypothetical protein